MVRARSCVGEGGRECGSFSRSLCLSPLRQSFSFSFLLFLIFLRFFSFAFSFLASPSPLKIFQPHFSSSRALKP